MMMNLFSTFDPSSSLCSLSWLMLLLSATVISLNMMKIKSPFQKIKSYILEKLKKEVQFSLKKNNTILEAFLMMLFTTIVTMNFTALYPQVFSITSHMTITFPLAMLIWVSIMLFGWSKNTNHMLSHLLPQGTPTFLMSFMVIIEMISNMIRPVTLCVRLTANLIAGHLLLTLLSNAILSLSSNYQVVLHFTPMMLMSLEAGVAIIQAYVFMTLITLYTTEIK